MYKLIQSPSQQQPKTVRRLSDNSDIPFDPDNTDYQAYLKFLEEGGQPLPAEENQ